MSGSLGLPTATYPSAEGIDSGTVPDAAVALGCGTDPLASIPFPPEVLQGGLGDFPFDVPGLEGMLWRTTAFLVGVAVVLLAGRFLVEPAVSRAVRARNRNNPTLEEAVSRYVRLVVLVCAVFVGVSVAGFTGVVGSSTLVIAAATLALGIAGQSVIGSLVSGTALVIDPEFNVGDYIRWGDGEGKVASITLRVTRVRTPDGGLATIPNTALTEESIVKPFHDGTRRIVEHVVIAYGDDIGTATGILASVTDDVDGILEDPEPEVGVEELGEDGVILRVEFWVADPIRTALPVRSRFVRAATRRLDRAGIEVSPASQRDLDGRLRVEGASETVSDTR